MGMEKSKWKVAVFYANDIDYFKIYRNVDRFMADTPKNREYRQEQYFSQKEAQEEVARLNGVEL